MRAAPIFAATLTTSLLIAGCPGRDTPPPDVADQPGEQARSCPGRDAPPQAEAAPARLAGLASFTAKMLRRGAGERSAEEIAEAIEFVGGDLWVETETDYTAIQVRVLRDHLDLALELLADLAQRPAFPPEEIESIRQRELDRLALMQSQPRWLAAQGFFLALYGEGHPYSANDAVPEVIAALNREHLVAFHRDNYVPRNALLVVSGDVEPAAVRQAAEQHFGGWTDRPAPELTIPEPPARESRSVIVIDRPGATQAQITVGNLALSRDSDDYVDLRVANQVLGGSASARLFMNLRERCSYSYGVYSYVPTRLRRAPLVVTGAIESQHTAGALREIFGELDRMLAGPPLADELGAAKSYLVGHFPILTETAGNLAELVTIQRVFGLPDTYWDTYRSAVAGVSADQAFQAAQTYLHPDRALVVIVGDACDVVEPARRYGPVTVINQQGGSTTLEALPGQWPGGEPPECPAPLAAEDQGETEAPPAPGEPRDMDFPEVHEATLDNGLEVLTVEQHPLPLVYLRLVIRSGSAADPSI